MNRLLCRMMSWPIAKKLSGGALALVGLAVLADILVAVFIGRGELTAASAGCYLTDAMVIGFHCQGFWASDIVSAWLNLPAWAVYGVMFAPYSFKAAVLAIVIWLPLIIFIVASRKVAQHA
ncbi:hypothetical protein [Marinobacterium marinum]|uniref:Uncharacterized protein n=1 Tax=Marinobacterium marinum TaxID=2756129 RepID=A0A7W1WYF0_9GAMM|nr:hypothetical protein [Marinobacterium marinum]MBA4502535.1 hypothetical protein [Marinobacterium marinum]